MNDIVSKKVLIIHPEGNSSNNPSLKCIIDLLLDHNISIDLRYAKPDHAVPTYRNIRYLPYNTLTRKLKTFIINRLHSRTIGKLFIFFENLYCYKTYDLIIGVDRNGLIEASILSEITNTPFSFISFEVFFEEETSTTFKSIEVDASKSLSTWLVQDVIRGELLQHENQLSASNRTLLPLASLGSGKHSTNRLRDQLGIPAEKKVAILIGSITEWSMARQIIQNVGAWPDNWVLILHNRYGNTSELLSKELRSVQSLLNQKIFISNIATEHVDEMGDILSGISAGLAFYRPTYTDMYDGKNLKYLGFAAGKISTYLRYGIPVIMNDIGLYAERAQEYQFGLVASQPEDIADCLITLDSQELGHQAQRYFDEHLDFSLFESSILEDFLSPLSLETLTVKNAHEVKESVEQS